ncbi:hypothetical protein [Dictyobacter arantiisoli]|nr:hypothetical protein [Dictyobacter arantiisoli]
MQPSFLRRRVLVAVAPDDRQAIELIKALRMQGLTVLVASTVVLAAQADEVAVCVVVLHPETWRSTLPIIVAMRCNPRYMIPVLEEPMMLPRAAWATEPFALSEFPAETARALAQMIRHHFQTVAEREPVVVAPRVAISPWLREPEPFEPSIIHKPRRMVLPPQLAQLLRLGWPLTVMLCLSFLSYYFFQLSSMTNTEAVTRTVRTTPTWRDHVYTAAVPGASCDNAGVDWEVPDHYKGQVSPSVKPGTIDNQQPVATPTSQVIVDTSTVVTCQQSGALLTHMNHYAAFATMIFASKGLALPQHFKAQITGSIVNTSPGAIFALGVRDQSNSDLSSRDSGYGNDTLQVGIDGSWEIVRYNNSSQAVDLRFARGFVRAARSYILAAETNGDIMSFSINNQTIATITDPTYADSYGVSFGLSDPAAVHAPSALFSQFVYQPLAETAQVQSQIRTTITPHSLQPVPTIYTAVAPGFGCDPGKGQWQPTSVALDHAITHCPATGLTVTSPGNSAAGLNIRLDERSSGVTYSNFIFTPLPGLYAQ